ncbi:HAMP domain-containing sensor histidine kinase [Luteipulveratus sp. YIM 133132]|uniref:sensor histidine kinase n=1 Tax=Luteipulveratus flavus TaxID=3031728 RepID=UPI0023B194CB|nr:HAMP domain-containing sensor histidine kinase [Luteipulveratus sp. YIM 133132]MDE9364678.1 HAMP domain-containing sensor histidine kinase [Luteipulveratus sp. YIM 133132]
MRRLLHPGSWSLRTTLVASMVLLFVAVTTAVGALTVLRLDRTLTGQVDDQLRTSSAAIEAGGGRRQPGPGPVVGSGDLRLDVASDGTILPSRGGGPDDADGQLLRPSATINYPGGTTQLTSAQIARLRAVPIGTAPRTVDLGGSAGHYRVVSVRHPVVVVSGDVARRLQVTTTVGLPVDPVEDTVRRTAFSVALLTALGLLVLTAAAAWVVRRSLAPLRRVAGTATRVSQLPLSSGPGGTQERVPATDTDTRTEVGQVGSALNGLLDHVDRSLAARHRSEMQVRQFVADASHELRTPLASIKGYAELSRREPDPVPQGVTHALGRIESEADRMTSLVEDLLLLARIDAGRPLDRSPVDLTRLAVETVSDAHAAGPEHVWSLDLPDAPCEVVGDEGRLRQVLINLLANARRHTPPGTTVTTVVRPVPDGGAELVVRDDGPGIPKELQAHVFERFTRGDSARTRVEGSTGLGLSIVRAVMNAHGGRVRLQSRPGSTEVILSLPGPTTLPGGGNAAPAGPQGAPEPHPPVTAG